MLLLPEKIDSPFALDNSAEERPPKVIIGWCLAVSLLIHAGACVLVLLELVTPRQAANVQYIDLDQILSPPSAVHTELRAPAEGLQKDAAIPLQAPEDEAAPSRESASVDTVNSEFLRTNLGRGMASGYFSSIGEGKSLRDDIREYYLKLLENINAQWWQKAETLRESAHQEGIVEILIGRDGTLHDLKFARKSGSREVDRAISDVLKAASPFPPLPAGFAMDTFRAPLKIAAPSHLFGFRSAR